MNFATPSAFRRLSRPGLCSILAVSLALAGCASPYVRSTPAAATLPEAPPASLSQAMAYSQAVHEAYRAKAIELGEAERLTMNGLVALTGAILGVGLLGGHANALRNAGVGGGTGYTLGLVNSDQRRAVTYVAGMHALQCANGVVAPLNLHPRTVEELRRGVSMVARGTEATSRALGETVAAEMMVRAHVPAANAALASAGKARDDAEAALGLADAAQVAAEDLLVKHALAGEQLQGAVQRIDAAVLDAVRGTEIPLPLLRRILAGLRDNVAVFSGFATSPAPQQEMRLQAVENKLKILEESPPAGAAPREGPRANSAQEQRLLEALARATAALSAETALLRTGATRLQGTVAAIVKRVDAKADATCEVRAPIMALVPEKVTFIEKATDVQVVEVRDGKPPYRDPQFLAASVPAGLTATFSVNDAKLALLTLRSDASQALGSHKVAVVDAAGDVRVLTVNVTPPAAPLEKIRNYLVSSRPVVDGVEVQVVDVTAGEAAGDVRISYRRPEGKAVTEEALQKVLGEDVVLRNLLGKGKFTVKESS